MPDPTPTNALAAPPAATFGPYSPIRRAGNMYFTAGHIGIDPASGTASPDAAAQAHQTLTNLQATLATVGLGLPDVVKTTVFVTNMDDFAAVNEIYLTFFAEPRPARSTVAVQELPRVGGATPLKIEIEAVAAAPAAQ